MKLLLHILRKDIRHFFPEILVNLALMIAFALTAPTAWTEVPMFGNGVLVAVLLRLLLPLGWLVLISRLVHDESLVGDRQFWITRPYPRRVLLGAKALFVFIFVHIPLFLMQCYLLRRGGLAVGPALGHLLYYQALLAAVFTLPFLALAVVTSTFGRHLLTVLGGILYLIALGSLLGWLKHRAMLPPFADGAALALGTMAVLAIVVGMYLRRPVGRARVALAVLPLVLCVLLAVAPARPVVRQVYAAASGTGDALQMLTDPSHHTLGSGAPRLFDRGDTLLTIPLQFHAGGTDQMLQVQGAQLTLRAQDGSQWTSPVEQQNTWFAGNAVSSLTVAVPLATYERFHGQPVQVELELATERYRSLAPQTWSVPAEGGVAVRDGGVCFASSLHHALQCRYPLQQPPPVSMAFEVRQGECGSGAVVKVVNHGLAGGVAALSPDFDPVSLRNLGYDADTPENPRNVRTELCPGAHVQMVSHEADGRERLTVTVPSLPLDAYTEHANGGQRQP